MGIEIYPIRLGADYCYVIKDKGAIMIDGGTPGKGGKFIKSIKKTSLTSEEIRLIILTHGHWDHIGSAKDIKEITGAKIAMHKLEKEWLEKSLKPLPPGVTRWGRSFAKILALFMPLIHFPATDVDITLGDEEFSLIEFGISGKVIHTPGHSQGSVSVLLETGDAFVGDMAMNGFPLRFNPGLPILAEDLKKVNESWKMLLEMGAKTIYPAHGNSFSAEIIQKALTEEINNGK
ncbi:MAG: MBL fold metallo-hydrolase [Thermodesulfobacteriota bacterium]|nr:MBL fold metallo-hydrolase [Thermodesulfobacteriota bacterium]